MITVLIPISRPEDWDNVYKNITQQTVQPKRVVFIRNGRGSEIQKDLFTKYSFIANWLDSDIGVAKAMNKGLSFIRKIQDNPWTKMDSDDEYGPKYLEELCKAIEDFPNHWIFGKKAHYIRLEDGLHLFNKNDGPQETLNLLGATLSCRTNKCPDFTDDIKIGEDFNWIKKCKELKWTGWSTGKNNFIVNRTGNNHTWKATSSLVHLTFGSSTREDGKIFEKPTMKEVLNTL